MTSKQTQSLVIGVVLSFALLLGGWLVVVGPQLEKRGAAQDSALQARTQNIGYTARLADLRKKKANLAAETQKFAQLSRKFPPEFRESSWAQSLLSAAKGASVRYTEITVSQPVLATADQVSDPGAAVGGTTAPSTTPTTAPDGTAPAPPDAATASESLAASDVKITVTGSQTNLRRYLAALKDLERPIYLDTVSYGSLGEEKLTSLSMTGRTFLVRPLEAPQGSGQ